MRYLHNYKLAFGHKQIEHEKLYSDKEKADGMKVVAGGEITELLEPQDVKLRCDVALSEIAEQMDFLMDEFEDEVIMKARAVILKNVERAIMGWFDPETGTWTK
ncbi:hypothetical protein [Hafnia phage Pocis76]|uniref:Uncharacterized protein n=1 Tax=Hafnia phage Pocis76 TaxID=2831174 RepID=A0A8E7KYU5_9CAUD|nr:hypothetical protein [Hafnia phage Pocis76]